MTIDAFFYKQPAAFQPETNPYLRCEDGIRRAFEELPPLPESTTRGRQALAGDATGADDGGETA